MPKNTGMGVSTDAVLGGGIRGSLEAWKQARLEELNEDIVALRSAAEDLQAQIPAISLDSSAETVCAEIAGLAQSTCAELTALADQKLAAKRFQTAFQIKHNIDRQPIVPGPYDSLPMLIALITIEGVATSAFFFGGGFVSGIGEAMVTGLTISGVNVVLSAGLGGYVFGRYWNYGTKCREQDPKITIKRWAGRFGAVLTACGIATLLIASGIVRATGDTEQLSYTLESLSNAAANFNSLLLWGIGLSFSVLAWRKGLSAFSDPYPGLSEAASAVTKASVDAVSVRSDALEAVEDLHEDALAEAYDAAEEIEATKQDLIETLHDFRHERERVVSAIAQAASDYEAYKAEQINLHHMVSGTRPAGHNTPGIDTASLRAQIPSPSMDFTNFASGFPDANKRARELLATSRTSAVEAISIAFKKTLD
ncbi:MAG: hypothetical protein ABJO52_20905 [Nisaea sp.]|uniref:hypothetical protein n=1 Tax=Nisaea sp. TaxID=2024842 RepID=UPI003298D8EF